ncbi:MAG: bifunctional oligoribonuclease/PAP phosphatase NrnA [Candidatus Omnitrophica bacterium]|nr:bifunctional oligoribonuclease/PAP phosphatase NrnA [Candidatus Omnitrophota bacterium]
MGINQVCKALKKYDRFLIAAHTSPEGDALGSQLGFYNLIRKLGKRGVILSDDRIPYGYDFLPGINRIRRLKKADRHLKFDCLVTLDCADLKRTGDVYRLNREGKPVLNIDHHISNRFFGGVNWVDPQASSCSEMIYRLYKRMRLKIDKDTALVLYTGIMTDTGSFHYSNTSAFTFAAAADLMKYKIDVAGVYRKTYENIPARQAKLLVDFLSKMKFFGRKRIAVFRIVPEFSGSVKSGVDLADQVLNFGRQIEGVEVVVLFREIPGKEPKVRVNLRSQGKVDVNKVAALFGGGGHPAASGCTVSGNFQAVSRKVVAAISARL